MNAQVYYNENDPFAAEWLRELIREKLIAPGHVDERSIEDVRPDQLAGYTQCHFFAGIGGWSYALRLAGWPDDRPVWTGSCPCQPFSAAGARKGADDPRHLWPAFRWLIDQCRPTEVFGEQVASKAGREWLAGVRTDLEAMGYAVGAADLCAASTGAPHIRQRLWWVANAGRKCGAPRGATPATVEPEAHCNHKLRRQGRNSGVQHAQGDGRGAPWSNAIWLPFADGKARRIEPGLEPLAHGVSGRVGRLRGYGNAIVPQAAAVFVEAFTQYQLEREGVA